MPKLNDVIRTVHAADSFTIIGNPLAPLSAALQIADVDVALELANRLMDWVQDRQLEASAQIDAAMVEPPAASEVA